MIRSSKPAYFARIFVPLVLIAGAIMGSSCVTEVRRTPMFFENVGTVAGKAREFGEPFGVAIREGIIYVSDGDRGTITAIGPDGSVAPFASGFHTPSGIAFAADGDLIVADAGDHTIRSVGTDGAVSLLAGSPDDPGSEDGPSGTARFRGPVGVAVSEDGRIFVSDTYNDRIRVIETGSVRTLAGSSRGFGDGTGAGAMFDTPLGVAAWKDGRVLVADFGNRRIRVVEPDGRVFTFAGGGTGDPADGTLSEAVFERPAAVTVSPDGPIFVADGNAVRVVGRRQFPFVETLNERRRGLADGPVRTARLNRPSGIAVSGSGEILIADSDNQLVRKLANGPVPSIDAGEIRSLRYNAAEFRQLQPGRWPYDPPDRTREIAGTLGEIRGEFADADSQVWFHNGLDIVGAYGETARFIRDEKVLDPAAVENFATLRELIRMPTIGYIHIRIGRTADDRPLADPRFLFDLEGTEPVNVRVSRGTRFSAGEPIGTLNAFNHVHLIAGRPGAEMNALDALVLPGISDSIAPVIEKASFYSEDWQPFETDSAAGRIRVNGRIRVIVRAYDRKDGNEARRRLAPYKIGYALSRPGEEPPTPPEWGISFARMPVPEAVKFAYAPGSKSGYSGVTIFDFAATNLVDAERYDERFLELGAIAPGNYVIRVFAADFFGNTAIKDVPIEVVQ